MALTDFSTNEWTRWLEEGPTMAVFQFIDNLIEDQKESLTSPALMRLPSEELLQKFSSANGAVNILRTLRDEVMELRKQELTDGEGL